MVYSIEQAELVAQQLEKFTTSYSHHLVSQFANLEFWLDEVRHAVDVIDGYSRRFVTMRDAQREWVEAHGTMVPSPFCPICRGECEFGGPQKPEPPVRIPSQDLDAARRRVKDAAYKLLLRGHRAGLLDEEAVRAACERVGTSVDPSDLDDARARKG